MQLKIFRNKRKETVDDVLKKQECVNLLEMVQEIYSHKMTALTVIIEVDKESFWYCAGLEPAQAILNLDQLHHRIQHEGLPDYD